MELHSHPVVPSNNDVSAKVAQAKDRHAGITRNRRAGSGITLKLADCHSILLKTTMYLRVLQTPWGPDPQLSVVTVLGAALLLAGDFWLPEYGRSSTLTGWWLTPPKENAATWKVKRPFILVRLLPGS